MFNIGMNFIWVCESFETANKKKKDPTDSCSGLYWGVKLFLLLIKLLNQSNCSTNPVAQPIKLLNQSNCSTNQIAQPIQLLNQSNCSTSQIAWTVYKDEELELKSTLVISNSKGLTETHRDIRTSRKTTNWTTTINKWICNLTPEVRNIYIK